MTSLPRDARAQDVLTDTNENDINPFISSFDSSRTMSGSTGDSSGSSTDTNEVFTDPLLSAGGGFPLASSSDSSGSLSGGSLGLFNTFSSGGDTTGSFGTLSFGGGSGLPLDGGGTFTSQALVNVTYTMQTGNFNATLTERNNNPPYTGTYNNSATEIGQYANGGSFGNTPGAAAFQTFTTTGVGTGTARALQAGDTFTITAYTGSSPSAGGYLGISFRDSTTYSSFTNSTDSTTEARFQLDNTGGWKIYNSGSATDSGQGAGADRTFVIKITSETTFDAQVAGTWYYNYTMAAGGGSIDSFAIYTFGDNNANSFWKNGALSNTGTIELGYALGGTATFNPGLIANGLDANSTTAVSTNAVFIGGDSGSIVILDDSNTYGTNTTVNANATARAANANAFGTNGTVSVTSGGRIQMSNGITVSRNLALNGDGISSSGSLQNISGNNTWSGGISNNSGARINVDAGTLTVSGNITNAASQTLYLGGASNATVSGTITGTNNSGNGSLYKDGAGTLTLSANNANLGGLVRLLGGTISITNVNSLGTGTLELGATTTRGVLLVNSNNSRSQNILITDGTTNSVINVASGQIFTNSGNVTGGANNATKFGKAGSGTLLLAGTASTYGGQIQVGDGTLIIGSNNGLSTNTSTSTRGVDLGLDIGDTSTANNVAVLASNGVTISNSFYVAPNTSSALRRIGLSGNGTNTFNNEIRLDGTLTVDAGTLSTDLVTISGVVSSNGASTGGITKNGAGTLVLNNSGNTYNGTTTLNAGTLLLSGGNNRIATNTTLAFGGTSTLNLGGNSQTLSQLTTSISTASTMTATNGSLTINGNAAFNAASTNNGSVWDFAGLNSFVYNRTNQNFTIQVGQTNTGNITNTFNFAATGTGSNSVSAAKIQIGGAVSNGSSYLSVLKLGKTNIFNSDTNVIGGYQGSGTVSFADSVTNASPGLVIRGPDGASRAGSLTIGQTSSGSSAGNGTLDLTNGNLNALVTNLVIGQQGANANVGVTGTLTMSGGNVDATTLVLGDKTATTGTPTITAAFNQLGGSVKAATMLFGRNATNTNAVFLPTYNLAGGTLFISNVSTSTASGAFSNTSVRNLVINGGILRNYDSSTDATIYGFDTTASGRLNILLSNNAANTIFVDASRTMTISNTAVMGGAGGFIKDGTGTLSLSAANTNTGAITVSNGTLLTTTSGVLGSSSAVSVASGATLQLGGAQTVGSIAGAGTVNMGANLLTFGGDNSSTTFSGAFSGAGGFTKNGTGTTTLTGAGVTSGTVTLNAGGLTLNPGSGNTLNLGTRFTMAPTSGTATATFSSGTNNISTDTGISGLGDGTGGTANFNVSGGTVNVNMSTNRFLVGNKQAAVVTVSSGTLNFTNNNSLYIGGDTQYNTTNAANGTLTISGGAVNVSGSGSFVLGVSTNATGTINLDGGTFTTARNITLGTNGTGMTGTVNFNGGTMVVNVSTNNFMGGLTALKVKSGGAVFSTTNSVTISNALTEDGTSTGGGLTKSGAGTLTLASVNTYTGATTISGGTLSYMGTNTSTATTVQSGATLAGSGSLGAVTVSSGGTISPGSSPGTLSVGALTWAGGGNYNWQVYNASGTAGATNGYDTILGDSLNITATTGNKFNINLWSLSGIGPDTNGSAINFTNGNSTNWTLGTFTNGITNFSTGVFSVNTGATNGTGGFANTFTGSFSLTTNSTNVILVYTAAAGSYDISVGANTAANQGSAQATNSANQLTGAVALNKLGAGTLIMTNPANDYTGVTTIQEGTVQINVNAPSGSAGALGNAITAVLVGDSTNALAAGFNIGAANVTNSRNLTVVAGTGAADRVIGTTISSGTADQAGGITLNTNAVLNAASGGTMLYSGVLTGSGNLTISNSGTSVFSAANDYTGTTTILNGATLRIANSSALGGTGSGTTVNSGGVLELTNGITSAEAITLSGSGIGSAGAVRSIRGNNTLSGALTLGAAARINSDSDLLTLSGGINGANHALTIGGSGNTTVSGAITNSTGLLTKEGSGTLILTGANTYSGGTLVSAGTLQGNTTGLQGLITNNARVIFDQSANGTHSSVISGTGVMVKTNTGVLTLTAANTQSGGTLIAQGTLSIGSGGTSGSLAGAITNNATLLYNRSDDLTQATVISGTGVLHKAGGGTLTLSQANTYSGATTISNGAIRISNATGLGTTAAGTTVDSGAALELSGGITVGAESLSLSGTGLGSGGALRNISGNNTYGGTITLGAASSIASDSGLLAITGDINGANNNLTFLGADNIAVSGAITNSSGTVVKGGAGTLTLSGNNTYTGATTVSNGATIVAAGSTALGSSSAATTVESGGVLAFSNASGFTTAENLTIAGNGISAGGALRNLGGANTNSGTITLSANATISADSGTSLRVNNINNGAANRQLTFSNAGTVLVSGNFSNMDTTSTFFKNGSGSLVISNTSANTGGAQLQVGQGSVTLAAGTFSTNSGTGTRALDLGLTAGNLGSTLDTAFYVNGGVTMSNSIYVAGGGGLRTLGTETTGTATYNNEIYLDSTVRLSAATNGNALFSGGFVNTGGIVKVGNGTVTLAGNNTVSGDVTISNGTLAVTNGSAINGNALVTVESGALLSVLGSEGIGRLAGAGTVNIASGQTLTNTFATNSSAFGGVLTGSGGFAKAGDGTLTLSGNSTGYSGDTVLNNGALLVGSDGAFGTGTVTINYNDGTGTRTLASSGAAGYSLNNNFNLYYNAFTLGQASGGTGSLTLGGSDKSFFLGNDGGLNRTITVNGYHTIAAGVTGANNILKQGSGTLALSGTSTFSGGIYIDQGGVDLAGGSLSAGVIDIGGGVNGIAVAASNAVLRVSTNGTFARTITVNGETNSSGVAGSRGIEFVNSAGTATLSGNVALEKAATLNVTNANGVGVLSGAVSGSGSLTKTGSGALVLSGNNTFTGGSTLSAGVLRAAHANALGTGALVASSGTVLEVTNGITLANNLSVYTVRFLNGGNTLSGTITNNNTVYDVASGTTNTLSGFVTGSGGVELIGGGVLAITGTTNNYTGNTTISNGTLRISTLANSNTTGPIGVSNNVTLAGANATNAIIDYTGGNVSTDRTFVMNDGGGTINMASSTTEMTLTGSASGTGKLIVGEGTLVLSNATANSFAPGSIQVDSGATLQLAANNQIGNSTGLILNGGTFRVGTASAGFSDTLGTLTLSASSTIDLGSFSTGVRQLTFANSSAITWTGTLTITNWQGVANSSSDVAEILFGTGGLTAGQLGQVYWANQSINGGALVGGGELVPVPEPRVYAAAVALLAAVGWRERRRLRALLAKGLSQRQRSSN